MVLFLASFAANLVIAAVVFVVCGGMKLWSQGAVEETPAAGSRAAGAMGVPPAHGGPPCSSAAENSGEKPRAWGRAGAAASGTARLRTAPTSAPPKLSPESTTLTPARTATLISLLALVVAVLIFDLDAGLTAITLAVLLSTAWPEASRKAVGEIAWPTVLLICGVLTYVGVLDEMGTITWAGEGVGGIGIPLLAAVLLCYIGALVSAFASSVGIMGALIPLAVPFLERGEIGAVGMIAALAVSATVVDVSPFSTNGALVLAAAPDVDRERFFRQLMVYGGIVVAVVPAAAWLVMVVPGWG
ncbi:SLC13 family permease [Streptomyces viridochromogenes]|uniref:SLC13 family permease n=1 Tax=Streptomyces viridochromogenes TaxID=1938 RepID=UPI0026D08259